MKPHILPFHRFFYPDFSLLFLLLQVNSPNHSLQTLQMPSSPPPVTSLLRDLYRKDPPVKSLLPSSLARSTAELTCDHRLYQVEDQDKLSDSDQSILYTVYYTVYRWGLGLIYGPLVCPWNTFIDDFKRILHTKINFALNLLYFG